MRGAILVLQTTQRQGAGQRAVRGRRQWICVVARIHFQRAIECVLAIIHAIQIVVVAAIAIIMRHIIEVVVVIASQSGDCCCSCVRMRRTRLTAARAVLLVGNVADVVQREGMVLGAEV